MRSNPARKNLCIKTGPLRNIETPIPFTTDRRASGEHADMCVAFADAQLRADGACRRSSSHMIFRRESTRGSSPEGRVLRVFGLDLKLRFRSRARSFGCALLQLSSFALALPALEQGRQASLRDPDTRGKSKAPRRQERTPIGIAHASRPCSLSNGALHGDGSTQADARPRCRRAEPTEARVQRPASGQWRSRDASAFIVHRELSFFCMCSGSV
jgi:hypothetical protein